LNLHEEFSSLALDVIGVVAFGYDFNTIEKGSEYSVDLGIITTGLEYRSRIPKMLWPFVAKDGKEYVRAINSMKKIPEEILKVRRAQATEESEESEHGKKDLLQRMMESKTDEGEVLSDQDILSEVLLFFLAGHETTANTLSWVVYYLRDRPDIVQKIRDEVNEIAPVGSTMTTELVAKLKYIEAVINETFRICPTAPITLRHALKDTVVGGIKVQKGEDILINWRAMHRSKDLFDNPDKFDPNRWLEDSAELARGGNKRKIFPFGEGPKMCVGQKLAMLELKIVLARFYQHFEASIDPKFEIQVVQTITLGPKEQLPVKLEKITIQMKNK